GEEVEVGLADGLIRRRQAEALGQRPADAQEAAVAVLEIDAVRHQPEEGAEQVLLLDGGGARRGVRNRCHRRLLRAGACGRRGPPGHRLLYRRGRGPEEEGGEERRREAASRWRAPGRPERAANHETHEKTRKKTGDRNEGQQAELVLFLVFFRVFSCVSWFAA